MSFPGDPATALLAASAGDTVKLFDVSADAGDPCTLSYTPSPGCAVNSLKWNHTNLVVASAGEDKNITLWKKNGQSMGAIPVSGIEGGDIEESIFAISFSNKGSRYLCSGGSGQVVRIWDLQRKRCIKWLRGHTNMITGAMYNCKDEHLASISLNGDLILHSLASGARAAELKDPDEQVLRVLDYSLVSRHLLATAGDDGTVHLWDTTGRSPKVSWLKQHSAPTVGISFSPSNDKIITTVGLDKKLYTFDSGSRRPSSCISYDAPFSSLAFRGNGWILAAGTSNGRVVFYDVRGKPQPFTVLHAYSSSEAVTSLCWQRSKPVTVSESNCSAEMALLGGAVEDSILMPDPLPSMMTSNPSISTGVAGSRNPARTTSSVRASSFLSASTASTSSLPFRSSVEVTSSKNHLPPGKILTKLQATRSRYSFKDDMEVFSPLVDVQPITPSLDKLWDDHEGVKKDNPSTDMKPSLPLFPSSTRRFPFAEDATGDHPIFDWKSNSILRQDDIGSSSSQSESSPTPSSKGEDSAITPPEAWGGVRFSNRYPRLRQSLNLPSRFGMLNSSNSTSGFLTAGLHDLSMSTSQTSISSVTNLSYANTCSKDVSCNQETSIGFSDHVSFSPMFLLLDSKGAIGQINPESPRAASLNLPRRLSTYAERIITKPTFTDGISVPASPKVKKTGADTREELLDTLLSRSNVSPPSEEGTLPQGGTSQSQEVLQSDLQQGTSFTLQLFQHTLEETLDSFQRSIHEDMRNLHIEILRQFHMQEMEMSNVLSSVLEKQDELMNELKHLREENNQLRQLF